MNNLIFDGVHHPLELKISFSLIMNILLMIIIIHMIMIIHIIIIITISVSITRLLPVQCTDFVEFHI